MVVAGCLRAGVHLKRNEAMKHEPKPPFMPEDIYAVTALSDLAVHPDGKAVAYVARTIVDNSYRATVYVLDVERGMSNPIDLQGGDAYLPAWSPDGEALLVLHRGRDDQARQVYLMAADGQDVRRLTAYERGVSSAQWSPDGSFVAFVAPVDPLAGQNSQSFAPDVEVLDRVVWQEDGKGNLLHRRQHLFVLPATGGEPVQLTSGHFSVGHFCFANDGKTLFYLATPDPEDDRATAFRADIFTVQRDGTAPRRITDFPGAFTGVNQAPDGTLYAIGNDRAYLEASPSRLWRVDAASGDYEALLPNFDLSMQDSLFCDVRFPSRSYDPWLSADGKQARFVVTDGPAVRVAAVSLETGGLTWLTPRDASVLGWHASADGQVQAEIRTSMTALPEVWVQVGDGAARQQTSVNGSLQDGRAIYAPQPIPFSASDGVEIDGWAILPGGEDVPFVLAVHGGPKRGIYGHAFLMEFHMLAGHGIGLVYCNYRGSDGYGTDFARGAYGHHDDRDSKDILEFLDHALRQAPGLDAQRIGLNGGGFGGYLSNWLVTQSNRFTAGISQRSIANWTSLYGASPIGFHMASQHMGCHPWEDPEHYRTKSPVTHAAKVETPLLLIHGERDLRCTMEQADQFFALLCLHGKEVRLARFPEEGHGMTRTGQPRHRAENLRLILDWFVRWLRP